MSFLLMRKPNPETYDLRKAKKVQPETLDTSGLPKIRTTKKRQQISSHTPADQRSSVTPNVERNEDELTPPNTASLTQEYNKPIANSKVVRGEQLAGEMTKAAIGFLIPQSLHQKINDAEKYLKHTYHPKLDRSAIICAMLADAHLWTESNLDKLVDKALFQLQNRMADRMSKRLGKKIL